jgi:hypothetical protein
MLYLLSKLDSPAHIPYILDLGSRGTVAAITAVSVVVAVICPNYRMVVTPIPQPHLRCVKVGTLERNVNLKKILFRPGLILPPQFPFEISPFARNFNIFFKTFL